ncbi:maleylpyruvate isomerase family mycothiol-dependent enzyme [Amycolatopsis jejuensis]|uniref:maleylpyruvate isomerase family mycothiol-dependent enzyme n=1 Tax=Amycolatopsis jejuensis TaxID=330084 RepID=UPI0005257F6B|nr:maleylpyruvate isomerase family mycothiol-dependent enzyme [Amycolatopsis jejuensis]
MTTTALDRIRELHDEWARVAQGLPDAAFGEPSALPGWTRAHLFTHVARNADAIGNLLTWAETGVEQPMYGPGTARDDAIEAGATRAPAEIVADLVASGQRLTEHAARLSEEAWSAPVRHRNGAAMTGVDALTLRLSETTIHLADLDAGHDFDSATALLGDHLDTVIATLIRISPRQLPSFRLTDGAHTWTFGDGGELVTGTPGTVLPWLTGRADGSALSGPVPEMESLL